MGEQSFPNVSPHGAGRRGWVKTQLGAGMFGQGHPAATGRALRTLPTWALGDREAVWRDGFHQEGLVFRGGNRPRSQEITSSKRDWVQGWKEGQVPAVSLWPCLVTSPQSLLPFHRSPQEKRGPRRQGQHLIVRGGDVQGWGQAPSLSLPPPQSWHSGRRARGFATYLPLSSGTRGPGGLPRQGHVMASGS